MTVTVIYRLYINYQLDALIIIYSSAHLQEDTVVYIQHMVLSLSMRLPGGLSVHSLSENSHSESSW